MQSMLKSHQLLGLVETFEVAPIKLLWTNSLQVPPGLDLCMPGGRNRAGELSGDMHVVKGTFQAVQLIWCRCGNYTDKQSEHWVLLWSLLLRPQTAVSLLRHGNLCFCAPGWVRLLFLPCAWYLSQLTGCFSLSPAPSPAQADSENSLPF